MCSASMMAPQRGVHMDMSRSCTFELTVCDCVKYTTGKLYLDLRSRGAVNGHAVATSASAMRETKPKNTGPSSKRSPRRRHPCTTPGPRARNELRP